MDLKCQSYLKDYFFIYFLRNEDLNIYVLFFDMKKVEIVDFSNYNIISIYDFRHKSITEKKYNSRIIAKDSNNIIW